MGDITYIKQLLDYKPIGRRRRRRRGKGKGKVVPLLFFLLSTTP
jgi:hypothetical protein